MRIKKLILENFRGFRKTDEDDESISKPIEIEFPDSNICVLIGENGSGKSSILDAIAISLTTLLTKAPLNQRSLLEEDSEIINQKNGFYLSGDDLNNSDHADFSTIQLDMELENEPFYIKETINVPIINGEKEYSKLKRKINPDSFLKPITILKNALNLSAFTNLPIIKYYDMGKMIIDNSTFRSDDSKALSYDQLYAYDSCLTKNLFDYKYFSFWFKDNEDFENEFRIRKQEDQGGMTLQVVRLAIETFIGILDKHRFDNLQITRKKKISCMGTFSLTVDKRDTGGKLKLSQLSSGEKAILLLVGDIARRIAIANPGLYMNEEKTDRDPNYAQNVLEGAYGIVLIDEVDLHLHPKWQQLVVPALTETFPNIQFIVTTHSPLIINRVKNKSVLITSKSDVEGLDEYLSGYNTYGADMDVVMKKIMRVESFYPNEVKTKLDEINGLLNENRLEEAKLKKNELETLIEPFHSELLTIQNIIDYKEMMAE